MTAGLTIRPMRPADVPSVVAIQVESLSGSLVTDLGPRFLARFHAGALRHPCTRALVAERDGALIGFALTTTDVRRFHRTMKPRLLLPLARALLTVGGWAVWPAFLRSPLERAPRPYVPAELLLLVVDGRARRHGAGRLLLDATERALSAEGVGRYRVAVRSALDVARLFYRAVGFEPEQERTVLGRPMTYLLRTIPTGATGRVIL